MGFSIKKVTDTGTAVMGLAPRTYFIAVGDSGRTVTESDSRETLIDYMEAKEISERVTLRDWDDLAQWERENDQFVYP
jgi:hypothetical protein